MPHYSITLSGRDGLIAFAIIFCAGALVGLLAG